MKLPQIGSSWKVSELKSAEAAALPNKLRGIAAKTQGITNAATKIGAAIDNRIDADDRIVAARTANALAVEIAASEQTQHQNALNDADSDQSTYESTWESNREKLIAEKTKGLNGRQLRHMEPSLLKFRGPEAFARMQRSQLILTDERFIHNTDIMLTELAQTAHNDPDAAEEGLAVVLAGVSSITPDTYPPSKTKALRDAAKKEIDTIRIRAYAAMREVAKGYAVLDDSDFVGADYDTAFDMLLEASEYNVNQIIQEEGNKLISNPDLYDSPDQRNAILANLPDDKTIRTETLESYDKIRFAYFVDGLASNEQYTEALEELHDEDNAGLMDGGDKRVKIDSIHAAQRRKGEGRVAVRLRDANNYMAILLSSGELNPAVTVNLREQLEGDLSESQRLQLQHKLDIVELTEDATKLFRVDIRDKTIDELRAQGTDLNTWSLQHDNLLDRQRIGNFIRSDNTQRITQLLNDSAGYVVENDIEVATLKNEVHTLLNGLIRIDRNDEAAAVAGITAAQDAVSRYFSAVTKGAVDRGVPEINRTYLPDGGALGADLSKGLAGLTVDAQLAAIKRLNAVITDPEMVNAVLSELTAGDSTYAAALSHMRDGNEDLAKATLWGAQVEAEYDKEAEDGKLDTGVADHKIKALTAGLLSFPGQQTEVIRNIRHVLFAAMNGEQLVQATKAGGSIITEGAIETAVELTVGLPFTFMVGNPAQALPYTRTDTGQRITPDEFRRQIVAAGANLLSTHGTEMYDAYGGVLDATAVLAISELRHVGEGMLEFIIPNSTLIMSRAAGVTQSIAGTAYAAPDESGIQRVFVLDMNKLPIPEYGILKMDKASYYAEGLGRERREGM